ncbi:MAG TPA: sulfite oxidase [Burkholderiaceae bacterium]|nr:sulfite oxidase [Burkholderiaceae bacterium]
METPDLVRRRLLAASSGVVALAGSARVALADLPGQENAAAPAEKVAKETALPDYAAWKDADSLIVHSANTIETKRSAFGQSGITPLDRLFVRNNVTPPPADIVKDPDAWTVEIEGTGSPAQLTLAELKTMGLENVPMVLQCSGNGRGFFPHKPSGTQWTVGAAGCVIFTGVPVRALLEHVGGIQDGMEYMTGTGGEAIPEGIDPNTVLVERSVPVAAVEHALLAWEINGEPLPLAHGGPLRLVVPGYLGVNNVKYLKRLAFTKEQSPANIQQKSYRFSPIGVSGTPEYESIWESPPKSWINSPSDPDQSVPAGRVMISGVAMGGMSAAKTIEVSVDGGQSWQDATFVGPDLGPYAWREFVFITDLSPGTYELASRTTNEAGDSQPEERRENNRGYINNSWRDHMVRVTVA